MNRYERSENERSEDRSNAGSVAMSTDETESGPVVLDNGYEAIKNRLAGAEGLVLCTDFDGTLAPIVEDPTAATITPENEAALRALAAHDRIDVAVISGRAVEDVVERVGIEGITYSGNHGLELARDGKTEVFDDAAAREDDLQGVLDEVDDRLSDIDGYGIEDKGVTATINYRRVADEDVPAVKTAVEEALEKRDGLASSPGKAIVEIRPAIERDKGSIVELLTEESPPGWIGAYLGDDTTDESAFRALGQEGISVFVGEEANTAARYRLTDPDAVGRFFEWLVGAGIEALERNAA
jgi:trehalose 6-phosphate phosphatase